MLVLSSPSGAGKTTLTRNLLEQENETWQALSISVTTRPRRAERDRRRALPFHRPERSSRRCATAANCWNGPRCTAISTARRASRSRARWRTGRDVLFDIDWQGTQQLLREMRDDVVSVFMLPPSVGRIEARGWNARAEDSARCHRAAAAKRGRRDRATGRNTITSSSTAISTRAFARLRAILTAERLKRERQPGLSSFVRQIAGELTPTASEWRPCQRR